MQGCLALQHSGSCRLLAHRTAPQRRQALPQPCGAHRPCRAARLVAAARGRQEEDFEEDDQLEADQAEADFDANGPAEAGTADEGLADLSGGPVSAASDEDEDSEPLIQFDEVGAAALPDVPPPPHGLRSACMLLAPLPAARPRRCSWLCPRSCAEAARSQAQVRWHAG